MVKLLALDLDGTLFYPKRLFRLLTKKNREFLQRFISKGNRVVLVSGRNYKVVKKVEKEVGKQIDMIGCNGSVIYLNDEIISEDPIPNQKVKEFYQKVKSDKDVKGFCVMSSKYKMAITNVSVNSFVAFFMRLLLAFPSVYKNEHKYGEEYLNKVLDDVDNKIYKVMLIYDVTKKGIEQARIGAEKYLDAYGTEFEVMWSRQSVEFMNKGINKSNALKKIIDMLHLNVDEVAVCGDSGNDIPLFESFHNSFVMKHAHAQVKTKANTEIQGVYSVEGYLD